MDALLSDKRDPCGDHPSYEMRLPRRLSMNDLVFLAVLAASLGLTFGLLKVCASLMPSVPSAQDGSKP